MLESEGMSVVQITMKNGMRHIVRGYEENITKEVNDARGKGKLIRMERDTIPTGEMLSLDPDEVESVMKR